MPATKPVDMPFRVVTTDTKTFVNGFETEDSAKASAVDCNKRAEQLGIKTRYEATTK